MTKRHDKFCLNYEKGDCCSWMKGGCQCQCTCDEISEIRDDERKKILKLIAIVRLTEEEYNELLSVH